jgi:hypothetical protein
MLVLVVPGVPFCFDGKTIPETTKHSFEKI